MVEKLLLFDVLLNKFVDASGSAFFDMGMGINELGSLFWPPSIALVLSSCLLFWCCCIKSWNWDDGVLLLSLRDPFLFFSSFLGDEIYQSHSLYGPVSFCLSGKGFCFRLPFPFITSALP